MNLCEESESFETTRCSLTLNACADLLTEPISPPMFFFHSSPCYLGVVPTTCITKPDLFWCHCQADWPTEYVLKITKQYARCALSCDVGNRKYGPNFWGAITIEILILICFKNLPHYHSCFYLLRTRCIRSFWIFYICPSQEDLHFRPVVVFASARSIV